MNNKFSKKVRAFKAKKLKSMSLPNAVLINPKIRSLELIETATELQDMLAICDSPYIGDDTRKLLYRDLELIQKKYDFLVYYPKQKRGQRNE